MALSFIDGSGYLNSRRLPRAFGPRNDSGRKQPDASIRQEVR